MFDYKTAVLLFRIYVSCGGIFKCTTESSTPMATRGLGNSGIGAPFFCVLLARNPVCKGVTPHLKSCVWFSAPHDKTDIETRPEKDNRAREGSRAQV